MSGAPPADALTFTLVNEPVHPLELAAIDRGSGLAIALVHGGVYHSGPAWARSIGPLADAGFRVIAVDRRGHGRSPSGEAAKVPVHAHAGDLRVTLTKLESGPVHLAGVSYGALVCLEFALSWPDQVRTITLVEPPLFAWLRDRAEFQPLFEQFKEIRKSFEAGATLEEWLPKWLNVLDPRMARGIAPGSPYWPIMERHAHLIFREESGWDYLPDERMLAAHSIPAMVLNGDLSSPHLQEAGRLAGERIPGAEHHVVRDAGHELHARKSEEFNSLLLEFIRTHP